LPSYRGSVDDVLDRFYQTARLVQTDVIVRVTPDNPFMEPEVLDQAVQLLLDQPELDYVSNKIRPTYPEGLDVEVFTNKALRRAWEEAALPSEREHVTPYLWKNPDKFQIASVQYHQDLSQLRWTVDYDIDFEFAQAIYQRLYQPGAIFHLNDVLALLEREPELGRINQGIPRHEGYHKSLTLDQL
jgi:spore coat polysaccharide biosynthesis protein SpsF